MKQNDWDAHAMKADVLKALAHPLRIAIVEFLRVPRVPGRVYLTLGTGGSRHFSATTIAARICG